MIKEAIAKLVSNEPLTRAEAAAAMTDIMSGEATEAQIGAFIAGLRLTGETPEAIAGCAEVMRANATKIKCNDPNAVDIVGTGGDGAHTFNISTAAGLVAAAAGVRVAKHGNRAVSSRSGSADVLERLGVEIAGDPDAAALQLETHGFCYLHAPDYHPGLRHAGPARKALGVRTLMNVLGPLVNPARPSVQLLGVFDPTFLRPAALVLDRLGCERALVVHGGGMDEIALHAPTQAVLLDRGQVEALEIRPEQLGASPAAPSELAGGEPSTNAELVRRVLSGAGSPAHRDVVALNAGALLWLAEAAPDLTSGARRAREVLAAGSALELLQRLGPRVAAAEVSRA